MTVYYVEFWKGAWYAEPNTLGIFSTRENATKAKERYCKENPDVNAEDVNIYEVIVDQYNGL